MEADRWPGRAEFVARHIPPAASVIDLGAGAGGLRALLPPECTYTGLDLPDFDMDAGRWPVGWWDVGVMLGVLEYATRPDAVLGRLRTVARSALITYQHDERLGLPRPVTLTPAELEAAAQRAGWTVEALGVWRTPLIRPQTLWRLT